MFIQSVFLLRVLYFKHIYNSIWSVKIQRWNTVFENPWVRDDVQALLSVRLEAEEDVMMMLSRKKKPQRNPVQTRGERGRATLLPPGGAAGEVSEARSLPSFPRKEESEGRSALAENKMASSLILHVSRHASPTPPSHYRPGGGGAVEPPWLSGSVREVFIQVNVPSLLDLGKPFPTLLE